MPGPTNSFFCNDNETFSKLAECKHILTGLTYDKWITYFRPLLQRGSLAFVFFNRKLNVDSPISNIFATPRIKVPGIDNTSCIAFSKSSSVHVYFVFLFTFWKFLFLFFIIFFEDIYSSMSSDQKNFFKQFFKIMYNFHSHFNPPISFPEIFIVFTSHIWKG